MTSAPDREKAVQLVDEARADGARLKSACAELGIGLNTYRRWAAGGQDGRPEAARPKPRHALTELEKAMILAVCHQSDYASLPPTQIVPVLLDEHQWYLASESSFYRVLRAHNEHHRRDRPARCGQAGPPPRHRADGPKQLWCWDVSYLKSRVRGLFYYLYFIIDVYSRKIVGAEVFDCENAANSREVFEKALLREGCSLNPPIMHADNGSAMKGATLLATFDKLNVTASYSRPSVSNDNAFSESLFGTAKQRPDFPPEGFDSLAAAQHWVMAFVHWYNHEHRHSGILYVTPVARHTGEDRQILAHRGELLLQAKAKNPGRWSGSIRKCDPVDAVWLNPDRTDETHVKELVH